MRVSAWTTSRVVVGYLPENRPCVSRGTNKMSPSSMTVAIVSWTCQKKGKTMPSMTDCMVDFGAEGVGQCLRLRVSPDMSALNFIQMASSLSIHETYDSQGTAPLSSMQDASGKTMRCVFGPPVRHIPIFWIRAKAVISLGINSHDDPEKDLVPGYALSTVHYRRLMDASHHLPADASSDYLVAGAVGISYPKNMSGKGAMGNGYEPIFDVE
ncbi:hypothetical protein BO70DRAFT_423553 [Aspergillus heteromorphus CBS 117.55]|uniref:Uncharacterized protein n=1 Tax=Aspergillus heteromorphus CBS 117.55 TaxID=1448321 RepID=A0A317WPN5_9EURO|nr:uncharacterized protein BO70DRAFT_423553 [Aspergillus heteromorphus CBS 117.55]PWY86250.1 hypothetical protein BO70DRAFT_423553 [Aspergillus heteromorphus CBS 117.55]